MGEVTEKQRIEEVGEVTERPTEECWWEKVYLRVAGKEKVAEFEKKEVSVGYSVTQQCFWSEWLHWEKGQNPSGKDLRVE